MVRGLRNVGCRVSIIAPELEAGEDGIAVAHPQAEARLEGSTAQTFNIKDMLRLWLLYPDADIRWSNRAAKAALKKWPEGVDWIITTSPPESCHKAGLTLKNNFKCHWMADMRDFWLKYPLMPVRKKPLRKMIERTIARRLLSRADLLTATTEIISEESSAFGNRKCHVLENFVDPLESSDKGIFSDFPGDYIHLVHTGAFSISDPDRKIDPVLKAFEKAALQNEKLILHLVGPLLTEEAEAVEKSSQVKKIKCHGRLPYETARHFQMQSHALIITTSPFAKVTPGKLSEYFAAARPIISVGEGPWEHVKGVQHEDAVKAMINMTCKKQVIEHEALFTSAQAGERVLQWMKSAAAQR